MENLARNGDTRQSPVRSTSATNHNQQQAKSDKTDSPQTDNSVHCRIIPPIIPRRTQLAHAHGYKTDVTPAAEAEDHCEQDHGHAIPVRGHPDAQHGDEAENVC